MHGRGGVRIAVSLPLPLQFLLVLFAGWVNREQQAVLDYVKAETVCSSRSSAVVAFGSRTPSVASSRGGEGRLGVERFRTLAAL